MLAFINKMSSWHKTFIAISHDLIMILVCYYLSLAIRLESLTLISPEFRGLFFKSLPVVSCTQISVFYLFGLYKGIWRYSSTYDLIRLIKGVSIGVVVSFMFSFFVFRLDGIPRSSVIIDWFLLIVFLGGGRLAYRLMRDRDFQAKSRLNSDITKILIVGAGAAGEQLLREIRKNINISYEVVGLIDDDLSKRNKILHGIKILGSTQLLSQIIEEKNIDEVFIAIPSATGFQIKNIVDKCEAAKVKIKVLPKMTDILHGNVEISHLRNINIEDILGRKEIYLDQVSIKKMILGKKVLVTGAGGSIGSELVVQLVKFSPKELYLIDISEINLFELERKVKELHPDNNFEFIIADVRDKKILEKIFQKTSPEIVLHAAAYKHVPLMEHNPIQAVKTNVLGTYNVAELSIKYRVKNFVQVSTDKAVNPTNIMGTTKRVAEILCQYFQQRNPGTHFTTVRFGNVLGSSGSVIPIFKKQIQTGGPITVTHPEIQRFFMSIPEACQLILQAATLGNGGEIFVLDMGEPVKIIDLAKQLIKLANLELGRDIQINITGLRPGEKLFEELLADKEATLPTSHPLVRTAKSTSPTQEIMENIIKLMNIESTEFKSIKSQLLEIVPEYDPEQKQNKIYNLNSLSSNQVH